MTAHYARHRTVTTPPYSSRQPGHVAACSCDWQGGIYSTAASASAELGRHRAAQVEPADDAPEPEVWSQADLDRAGDDAAEAEAAARMGGA